MSTDSGVQTKNRFNTEASAEKYAGSLGGTPTHFREVRCIREALGGLPKGAKVLDMPSGTGRLMAVLVDMGFQVTEADSSPHMIEQARRHAKAIHVHHGVEFRVEDAFATTFPDDAFDGILCNRLLHHFPEANVRRRCLRELARICPGPIVASFFCNQSLGAFVYHLKNRLRGRIPTDRVPIPLAQFVADAEAAGLRVVRTLAARPWIGKQWYAVLERSGH
jgi:2-polyprenyl-3-methyl-5-hydroxy-6-metoxy-1,4-benzoquinol methylase